ncbi:MAG TPA: amidohydrolase family protein [Beijerinckiaceae bacterium]|nr:amidohydrolase family protein [Beijerinckiaceae bacterium]
MLPVIRPPNPAPRKPVYQPPAKACDTHLHIYGPFDTFPLKSSMTERLYTPTEFSTFDHYLSTQSIIGFERGVIVTGNPCGRYNNEATFDAIRRMEGRFKGIAFLDSLIDQKELERLASGGFTGYRIRQRALGSEFRFDAERTAGRVRDFGWHVEVQLESIEEAVELIDWLPKLRIPYLLDHVARARPERGLADKAFQTVLRHYADNPDCWINFYSFYQLSSEGPPHYSDVIPIVAKIVETNADRVVWGSNWPHAVTKTTPDDGDLVDFIPAALPDPAHRQKLLVDNPARLYGWAD